MPSMPGTAPDWPPGLSPVRAPPTPWGASTAYASFYDSSSGGLTAATTPLSAPPAGTHFRSPSLNEYLLRPSTSSTNLKGGVSGLGIIEGELGAQCQAAGLKHDHTATWAIPIIAEPGKAAAWGAVLLSLSGTFLCWGTYALLLSKWLPPTGVPVLDAIAADRFYCLLVPLTVPVTLIMVFLNWLSMQFFKSN